jgi:hypothetical protein
MIYAVHFQLYAFAAICPSALYAYIHDPPPLTRFPGNPLPLAFAVASKLNVSVAADNSRPGYEKTRRQGRVGGLDTQFWALSVRRGRRGRR